MRGRVQRGRIQSHQRWCCNVIDEQINEKSTDLVQQLRAVESQSCANLGTARLVKNSGDSFRHLLSWALSAESERILFTFLLAKFATISACLASAALAVALSAIVSGSVSHKQLEPQHTCGLRETDL